MGLADLFGWRRRGSPPAASAYLAEAVSADGRVRVRFRTLLTMRDRLEYDTQAWAPTDVDGATGDAVRTISASALSTWLLGTFCVDVVVDKGEPRPFTVAMLDEFPDDGNGFAARLALRIHREVVQAHIVAVEAEKKTSVVTP